MSTPTMRMCKFIALVTVFGFLALTMSTEARSFNQQQQQQQQLQSQQQFNLNSRNQFQPMDLNSAPILMEAQSSSLDHELDSDDGDDDDDDDKVTTSHQSQNPLLPAGTDLFFASKSHPLPMLGQQYQTLPTASTTSADLKTSASHHHKKHGVKGWLDMGAWTGKKGAFGWHDKHPVGKGK